MGERVNQTRENVHMYCTVLHCTVIIPYLGRSLQPRCVGSGPVLHVQSRLHTTTQCTIQQRELVPLLPTLCTSMLLCALASGLA